MFLSKLGIALLLCVSVSFFVFPVGVEWGFIPYEYTEGILFLLLGVTLHAGAFLLFGTLKN